MTTNNTEKNPEQKEKKNFRDWFTEGIILAILSILGYCIPYIYSVSYASYYHIPPEFISNDIGMSISAWLKISSFLFIYLIFLIIALVFVSIIQWPFQYKKDSRGAQIEAESVNGMIFFISLTLLYIILVFAFDFSSTLLRKFLFFDMFSDEQLQYFSYIFFLFIVLGVAHFYEQNKNNLAFQLLLKLLRNKIIAIFIIVFLSIIFISRIGLFYAENQKDFYTYKIKDKLPQEMVVIFSNKDFMVSCPLNRASKTMEPRLTILKTDDIAGKIDFSYEKNLGILKPVDQ